VLKETPLWLQGVKFPALTPDQQLPEQADVVIIGGGYTGLSAALTLAQRKANVVVLEQHAFGWSASARNGGQVLTGLKDDASTLVAKFGMQQARAMFDFSLAAIDCVEQTVHEQGIDCNFVRSGHLTLAAKPSHFQGMVEEAALLKREFQHHTYVISPAEMYNEINSPRYHGALLDPLSASVQPARYLAGLAWSAKRAGAQLFPHTPAVKITKHNQEYLIETPRGTIRAAQILAATGAATGNVTPKLQRRVVPVGSYIIATAPISDQLADELNPNRRVMYDTKNFLYYFRLSPDQRVIFGGRARFFPETPQTVRESADILHKDMLSVYPQLRDTPIEYVWGGSLDFTFDFMPHLGTFNGIHYALGFAGHGVAMASYFGNLVGKSLAGETINNPFSKKIAGAPLGLYDGRPWFLPFAGMLFRIKDLLG
jgi:glycine/D-amino acid oxidase-like deaminating enzyme